jgi:predicted nucleic acid-binding protein
MQPVVIDTNIVLDMWVFDDLRSRPLNDALQNQGLRWLASAEMREELLRVLDYPHLVQRMVMRVVSAADVLAQFDQHAHSVPSAERAPYVCNDAVWRCGRCGCHPPKGGEGPGDGCAWARATACLKTGFTQS